MNLILFLAALWVGAGAWAVFADYVAGTRLAREVFVNATVAGVLVAIVVGALAFAGIAA